MNNFNLKLKLSKTYRITDDGKTYAEYVWTFENLGDTLDLYPLVHAVVIDSENIVDYTVSDDSGNLATIEKGQSPKPKTSEFKIYFDKILSKNEEYNVKFNYTCTDLVHHYNGLKIWYFKGETKREKIPEDELGILVEPDMECSVKIDFSHIKEKFFENFFYEEYKEDAGNPEYDRDSKTLEWNFVLKPDEKGKEINVLYGKRSKDNLIKIAYLAFGAMVVEGIRLIFAYLTPD